MKRSSFPLISARTLLEVGTVATPSSFLDRLAAKSKAHSVDTVDPDQPPGLGFLGQGSQKKISDFTPTIKHEPDPDFPEPVPSNRGMNMPHPVSGPTLAQKHRSDLPHGHERVETHIQRFEDPSSKATSIRHLGNSGMPEGLSVNPVLHAKQDNGHQVVANPLGTMSPLHEPEMVGPRNAFLYDLLSGMGAHHMAIPGHVTNFYGKERVSPGVRTASSSRKGEVDHAGQPAYVSEFVPGEHIETAPQEKLDKVDEHHRLVGAIAHLVTGESDGHGRNVMLVDGPSGPHPVLYDADGGLGSMYGKNLFGKHVLRGDKRIDERPLVRSEFLYDPDHARNRGRLAPRREWGTQYPSGVTAMLQEIAAGGHVGRHGIGPEGERLARRNAHDLLTKGFEQTLRERHLYSGEPSGM